MKCLSEQVFHNRISRTNL